MNKKRQIFLLIILVAFLFYVDYSWMNSYSINEFSGKEIVIASRIIDGDTIAVENNTKVRLLGINTPEKGELYYKEAKDYLDLLISNKTIELERGKENFDLYKRKLRYIFIDAKNINLELVKNGFANSYFPSGKDKYSEEFYNAWKECLNKNINLCEKSKNKCAGCIQLTKFDNEKEIVNFYNACDFDCNLNKWTIKDEGRKKFAFQNFILKTHKSVSIITGNGNDNSTNLYWKNYDYVWTKTGDTLFLRDENGKLVLYSNY